MLVLIATNELQGAAPGDYAWTVEGELVTPVVTDCSAGDECGCNRGFPGLASGRATTTAMVVERPGITEADLRDAVVDWLDRSGWIRLIHDAAVERSVAAGLHGCIGVGEADEIDSMIAALVDEHLEMISDVCSDFPAGTVVTRRGELVSARRQPSAA
jgi:hypothetical protein